MAKRKPKPPTADQVAAAQSPPPEPVRQGWWILAVDPAQSTGWAFTRGKWGIERFYRRPWRHPYAHYLDFRGWLLDKIDELKPTALASEGCLSTGSFRGEGQRHEWHGIVCSVAAEVDLPLLCVMPSSLKQYATNNGRAERPEMRAALKERFQLDLPEDQHDAIAAIWVLSWATNEANEGRIVREWSGFPDGSRGIGRDVICNRCQTRFPGGMRCPRCGSLRTRLEA